MDPERALLAVTAAHAGFQVVVSTVVYPALADVGRDRWVVAHDAHSRRISYVVAPLYLLVLGACAWVVLAGPVTPGTTVAVAGNLVALAVTACVAAPTHGRLGREGHSPSLVAGLLRSDRLRTLAAVVALIGAAAVR